MAGRSRGLFDLPIQESESRNQQTVDSVTGIPGGMGRQGHIFHREERTCRVGRLIMKNIKRTMRQSATLQRFNQRVFIDQRTTGSIYKNGPGLGLRKFILPKKTIGFWCECKMEG